MTQATRAPHPAARVAAAIGAVMALVTTGGSPAAAQTVWRCGADGSSYSERPCQDTGRTVDVRNPRSANGLAEARAEARQWQAAAQRLAADREARDRANPPWGPTALNAPRNDLARTSARAGRRDRPGAGPADRRGEPSDDGRHERRGARRKTVHGLDPAQGFIAFAPPEEATGAPRGAPASGSKPR